MSDNGIITTKQYHIDELIFAEYNPRQLTKDQYQGLKDSITRFGLVDPVIINKHKERDNIIIGGHQRVKVAKDLGYKEVPCVEVNLTPEKERELNIRLNKNVGEWDWDSLANYFDPGELTEWGFTEDDIVGFYEFDGKAELEMFNMEDLGIDGEYIEFKFGDFSGKISKSIYVSFVGEYEKHKSKYDMVMIDDVLKSWLTI